MLWSLSPQQSRSRVQNHPSLLIVSRRHLGHWLLRPVTALELWVNQGSK